jgi:hypothetical protein
MDAAAFDRLAQTLVRAASRRAALGVLLTTAGATFGLAGIDRASAQGCTVNGEGCHLGEDCCSGLCKRRNNGTKVCMRADNQGECTVEENACTGGSISCGTGSFGTCLCCVTAAGRSFCGGAGRIDSSLCDCTSNKECERRIGTLIGKQSAKGSKCVAVGANPNLTCFQCGDNGTGCMPPCETLDSPE